MMEGSFDGQSERSRYWERHLSEWRKSGQSQAQYCREHGLRAKSFGYWLRKARCKDSIPQLVEICLGGSQGSAPESALRLYVGDIFRVDIPTGFDSNALRQLLLVLEGR